MATGAPKHDEALDRRFDQRWVDWVVEQLLAHRSADAIVDVMVRRGFPQGYAGARVAAIAESPILTAAARAHRMKAKAASFLELEGELFRRSGFTLERLELTPVEFYAHHVFANRPVVLPGLMREWPALTRWAPEELKARFGDVVVEVTSGRQGDERYEDNFRAHTVSIPFAEYVDMVVEGGTTNDHYLVARNEVLDKSELSGLRDDFSLPSGFLDPAGTDKRFVRLWFGPAGTVTPLHCDNRNVLFGQVRGRKRVRLVPPQFLGAVGNNRSCYSAIDLENVDLDRFPEMRDVPVLETIVEPGEFLFIPVGWWHEVRSLELSMSLSFTNLRFNDPEIGWHQATW
jgi:Cupin-like domain